MCLSKKHVEYLERTNESDFQQGKISYETYIRFTDIVERCRDCDLCGNNEYGDILGECRLHFLRVFASMKRDMEKIAAERRVSEAAAAGIPPVGMVSDLAAIVASETGVSPDSAEPEPEGEQDAEAAPGTEKQTA